MLNWVRKLYGLCWALAVAVLVVLALYASLGRYYIGYLEDYQSQAIESLEQATGLTVTVESVKGSWSGLSPWVHVTDLQVYDGERPALSVDRADIKVGVLSGLINRRVELTEVHVRQLSVHLHETGGPGGWTFAGIALKKGDTDTNALIDSIMAVREAQFANTRMQLHYLEQEPATFRADQVDYVSDSHFRRLQATLRVEDSEPTRLLAEASGDPRHSDFMADVFLQLQDSRFEALAPLFGELSELADGRASGNLWLSVRPGYDVSLTGSLDIPRVAIGAFWKRPEQMLEQLSVKFGGRYRDGLWEFWCPHWEARWHDKQLAFDGLRVAQVSRDPALLQVSLPEVDAADTAALLLESEILPDELAGVLGELSPTGRLRAPVMEIPLAVDDRDSYRFRAELDEVGVQPWRGAPGVEGLNGYLEAGAASGRAVIDAERVQLRFERLYPDDLAVQQLRATVGWQIEDGRVLVDSGPISMRDGDVRLGALLSLDIPTQPDAGDPLMTLAVGLRDGDAAMRDKYIPAILSDKLRRWLDKSIVRAEVPAAGFVYRGSLRKNDRQDRTVQLFFDVRDAELDYHEQWPAVRDAEAGVVVDDGRVKAIGRSARLYDDTRVEHAHVTVTPEAESLRLRVAAQIDSSVSDALRVIRESPLREQVGATFDNWQGRGRADTQLQLDLLLADDAVPAVLVRTQLNADSLSLPDYGLAFSHIRGPLTYSTDSGLNSGGLTGKLFGKPLKTTVRQSAGQPIEIDISGRLAAQDLREWLKQPVLSLIEGETAFDVKITAAGDDSMLRAHSSLRGMKMDLPPPLHKAAEETRPLSLQLPLARERPVMTLRVEQMGELALGLGGVRDFGGAVITLGADEPAPLSPGIFKIGGVLPSAGLTEWQVALERYLAVTESAPESEQAIPFRIVDLQVNELTAFGQKLSSVTLNGDNGPLGHQRWQLKITSDLLAGELILPRQSDEVLRVVLSRLSLPAGTVGGEGDPLANIDPRELMDIDLDIDHLWIGEENWGQLGFNLRSNAQGASFNRLRGELRGVRLADGTGVPTELVWSRNASGDESSFKGNLSVADIGAVLERWQFQRLLVSDSGRFGVNLYWEGAPPAFSILDIQGTIGMQLEKGRFLRASDTAGGTLRMVSIFNFANILRRLQLDFSDVFRKGIHYDEIDGVMHFREGVMHFREPLRVSGPSSRFRMGGSVNFNTNLTDMELTATLPIGTNLPWIAALVGGLPAAAGLFVASKLFEEQVDKYSSAVYSVTGPWQDPELKFRKIFDDELSGYTEPSQSGPVADRGDRESVPGANNEGAPLP